ncbi:MAG: dihydrolipoyl dehydrogenase [Hyphomicrobiales bacterium]
MNKNSYDVIVVGAGPGGYVAAIRAAQLGQKTAIVEREHLGGICLNWGCIPTKALLRSAEILDQFSSAQEFGIDAEPAVANVPAMVARSREISAKLNGGVAHLLKKNKVDVIWGEAKLCGGGQVEVSASQKPAVEPAHPVPRGTKGLGIYNAKNIIVATGARPRILKGFEPDGEVVLTYFEAMKPKDAPKSLLIMGSGAIGMEFASFYHALGSNITIVELLPEVLPQEDDEISKVVRKEFEKHGIRILTRTKAEKLVQAKGLANVTLTNKDGQQSVEQFEKVISAIGVVPNIENLGLESLGVDIGPEGIITNGVGATSVSGIHAIGDVTGAPMLAHKAEHEAVICVEAIVNGHAHPLDKLRIPGCTYCKPQVASVGLTETAARQAGYKLRIGRFPFSANGKALAVGDTVGLVKTIFDKETGELLGAHLVGPEVTELVQGFVTAIGHETTEEHLMKLVYPHPTLSEAMHESVLDAFDIAIHK